MNCQNCNHRQASIHLTQVVNNKLIEMYLCEQCAAEKGKINLSFSDFFSSLMGLSTHSMQQNIETTEVLCKKCGMSYEEFQRIGKFGCDSCCEAFGERIKPLLKRIHGSTEHAGKVPKRIYASIKSSKEIEQLKDELARAISVEEYELAAKIRDKIRSLEVEK